MTAFAEALARRQPDVLAETRTALANAAGPGLLVEAAAVAANFQRMVRIADSTGIPIDARSVAYGADVREELNLNRFGSAENTPPPSLWQRLFSPILRTVMRRKIRQMGRAHLQQNSTP